MSLGGTAPVTSHGRDQAGLKSFFLQIIDRDPGYLDDVVDPPAAGGNRHLGTLGQALSDPEFFQLLIDRALNVGHARTSECLLGEIKFGKHDFTLWIENPESARHGTWATFFLCDFRLFTECH